MSTSDSSHAGAHSRAEVTHSARYLGWGQSFDPQREAEQGGLDVNLGAGPVHWTSQSGLPLYFQGKSPLSPKPSPGRSAHLAAKKIFDLTFAVSALLVLAPLLVIIATVIKLTDRGPVFFRQARVGKGGKTFRIYKFRSMYSDECDHSGVAQTVKGDQRIMPIGHFIRRTSIDELPQLLNVLKGDMSVVGPRPHVEGQKAGGRPYADVVPYYDQRNLMLPGLTGWAQANGFRGPTVDVRLAQARVDHDIAYIQNFSILLDLKIVARTALREFITGSGT